MNSLTSFKARIREISEAKKSDIVLALDPPYGTKNIFDYVMGKIELLSYYSCAIKLNFHVILPLSSTELKKITKSAHDNDLQVIADLKLNDIFDTNKVVIQHLASIGFDSAILNPFIGKNSLISITQYAHSLKFGIIALVYMSHPEAVEGYGALIQSKSNHTKESNSIPLYRSFYNNSVTADVDGVVIGGNRLDVIKEFSHGKTIHLPIYSPGLITQGGNVQKALTSGTNYLIIGRAILESNSPVTTIRTIQDSVLKRNSNF
jgi:orotidine-5'-phosphate decarboxylase